MKKLFTLFALTLTIQAQATCLFIGVEEAQCSAGQGPGGPKTILKGQDKCPGKDRYVRCQKQSYEINGKSYSAELKVDHVGNTDWCGYVKCSAPPGPSSNGTVQQVLQNRQL